ncbi:MAG TPA: tripartite tricarboxylate transporter substrate binding protein [Xanthobacteraceae bacterium]|nr:tripartite tricarboxylate transporter substrate binding protein [Xanthobacteraceae bacterium]
MNDTVKFVRVGLALGLILLLAAALNRTADAQITGKSLRLIVPFPPGGATDVLARLLAQEAGQISGQSVVTENRPGAGTVIATEFVSRAPPDGTTVLMMANSFVINPIVRSSLPYDPFSFEPICLLVNSPQVLVVNASSPYKTLDSFVLAAKARPGELNYAAVGPATTQHIAGEMFKRAAEINLTYVPYAGGAPAVNAILGGHVTAIIANYSEVMEQIKAGRLRPLAVAARERIAPLPDVPTMAESGYKNVEATAWFGMMAPPRTNRETLGQLIALFKTALDTPDVQAKLVAQGLYPANACGADFAAHIKQQYENYERDIKEANIRAE